MKNLLTSLDRLPAFEQLLDSIKDSNNILIKTPQRLRPFLLSAVKSHINNGVLIITDNENSASLLGDVLRSFGIECNVFPEWETLPHERVSPDPETVYRRMRALNRLANKGVAICSSRATMFPVPAPSEKRHEPIELAFGESHNMDELINELTRIGYDRVVKVEAPGEIAVRGGLIDISPPTLPNPVRIEFFGDEVDSIRYFDPISQNSIEKTDKIVLFPVKELVLTEEKAKQAINILEPLKEEMGWLEEDIERLGSGIYFDGIEAYLPFLEPKTHTIFDYLGENSMVVIDKFEQFCEQAAEQHENQLQYIKEIEGSGLFPHSEKPYVINSLDAIDKLDVAKIRLVSVSTLEEQFESITIEAGPGFAGPTSIERIKTFTDNLLADGYRVIYCLQNDGTLKRTKELLEQADVQFAAGNNEISAPGVYLIKGIIHEGFIQHDIKLAFVTEEDLFGPARIARRQPFQHRTGQPVSRLSDLTEGDLVVHRTHGIGVFMGLLKQEINGTDSEYMQIEYLGGDKLFVPANSLDRITKYQSGTEGHAKLTRLGSGDWSKTTSKVKKSIKKLAINLAHLYRERAQLQGLKFSADSPWQTELEDAFPYEETSDQAQAINDVKHDMEGPRPMDRLVCGDVGFGKTEVALRAAFKCVVDGKQVMLLVPTTILARQHYKTFAQRMSPFPVRIGLLSRLVTTKDQKNTVEEFNAGQVDILIGTHALLSKNIQPPNLGLIIVDEEHRFGVGQKEKLKLLRKNVDSLTMTATPIPRTLQLSLSGIRDLSLMETPPTGRRPINTYVGVFDAALVKAAIRRELAREGQVFYVHNRVEDIYKIKEKLSSIVPEAAVEVIHGQMNKDELERVMNRFFDKEVHVLLSTSIIEAGIDIPNANTLIVDNAETLGLAQLYQIRGRIGRSHQKAHAYFLVQNSRILTKEAGKRLQALADLTALGSGLKIALKDLEIRGAGDLLGPEQHGQIENVGFDLYADMLSESVNEAKGEPVQRKSELTVTLPVDAYVPKDYVADQELRIELYRQLSGVTNQKEAKKIMKSIEDRFGKAPKQVLALAAICQVKAKGETLGLEVINYVRGKLKVKPISPELGEAAAPKLKGYYHNAEKAVILNTSEAKIIKDIDRLLDLLTNQKIQSQY